MRAVAFWDSLLAPEHRAGAPLCVQVVAMLGMLPTGTFEAAARRLEQTRAAAPALDPALLLRPDVWTQYERLHGLLTALHGVHLAMERMAPPEPTIRIVRP